jgi:hypothetical protein
MRKLLFLALLLASVVSAQSLRGGATSKFSYLSNHSGFPLNGLIAAWDFSEGTGLTSADLSGNGYTATLAATSASNMQAFYPKWLDGGGVALEGYVSNPTQYLSIPVLSMGSTSAITVIVAAQTLQAGLDTRLVSAANPVASYVGWQTGFGSSKYRYYSSAGGGWKSANTTVDATSCRVYGMSVSGSTGAFYLDGVPDGSISGSSTVASYATAGYNALAAQIAAGTNGGVLKGALRYVLVYNRALSPGEHWQVKNALARFIGSYIKWSNSATQVPFPPNLVTVPSNGMMTLPPMGWNSWYVTSLTTTDTQLKAQMDAMVSTGLLAAGYNIAGFTEPLPYARDSTGGATISHLFVSSPGQTCTYAHGLGLLCGWYTGPHATTCGGGVGSYGWDRQDVAAYAAAGVDEIFYDGSCTTSYAAQTALYGASATARTISQNFGQLLLASGRNIAWELSITGNSSTWWPLVGSNITRVGTDSMHTWANIDGYFTQFASLSAYQSVGHWLDPDMLVVGNGITDTEGRTQMSMYAMWSSPLIVTTDLTTATAPTLATLLNSDVISVDQDPLGLMALRVSQVACGSSTCEVWAKQMNATNKCAVAFLNRDTGAHDIATTFSAINAVVPACGTGPYTTTRDLWAHASLGTLTTSYTATAVPAHGVFMMTVAP